MNKDQARLVLDLLALYDAAWNVGKCRRDCECERCAALDKCGDYMTTTHDELRDLATKEAHDE